jgi:DNA polymerase-3 subunit delta
MIRTLTGSNSFLLQHELKQLVASFVAEQGDLALERLDGEDAPVERISEALNSLPFLADKKMVVLRSPSANKQFIEKAEQILGDLSETTEVILVEPKLDKRLSYYKFLKKSTDFQEFNELDVNGLARWLAEAAKAQSLTLSANDSRYLVERLGLNQLLLGNELEKLGLYDQHITRRTIDLLTEASPQTKIFDLLDAAFSHNPKRALQLYADQRAQKVEPQIILSMLARQLQQISLMKTAGSRSAQQVASDAKVNAYPLQKSAAVARRLSLANLKSLMNHLLDIDTRSKRESLDLDDALQHFILTLTTQ